MFSGVTNGIGSISQIKQQFITSNKNINLCKNTKKYKLSVKTTQIIQKMALSSRTKSSVSIDLFNLPPLPDARRQYTMQCEILNDFFLPDGKNT